MIATFVEHAMSQLTRSTSEDQFLEDSTTAQRQETLDVGDLEEGEVQRGLVRLREMVEKLLPKLSKSLRQRLPLSPSDARHSLSLYQSEVESLQTKLLQTIVSELDDRGRTPGTGQNENESIVEMIALNQPADLGFQTLAAILRRRNGELDTVVDDKSFRLNNVYKENEVVRYELSAGKSSKWNLADMRDSQDVAERISDLLWFKEEDDRYFKIEPAHMKTFGWVMQSPDFQSESHLSTWLASGQGLFWVNGKAGSGKSTLMKYVHQHPYLKSMLRGWKRGKELVIAHFFFWHAGHSLQKSMEGVLRSILRQILIHIPALLPVVLPRLTRSILTQKQGEKMSLIQQELLQAIRLLARHLPDHVAVCLIIDGVDEFAGSHLDFAKLLVEISQHECIKVLVSSRPTPECCAIFEEHPNLKLQDLTRTDISSYIEAELLSNALFIQRSQHERDLSVQIKHALLDKCMGVFLWIVLVTRQLFEGLVHYESKQSLLSTIDDLPSDLEDLYQHMFAKMSPRHQEEGSTLLQLLIRAYEVRNRPVTALQFALTEANLPSSTNTIDLASSDKTLIVVMLTGRLRSRCCGLIEVENRNSSGKQIEPLVNFLHRTVYDYLRNPSNWSHLKQLREIERSVIDRAYLYACAQLSTFHLDLFNSLPDSGSDLRSAEQYFSDCTLFAYELTRQKGIEVEPRFLKVDDYFLNISNTKNGSNAQKAYEAAWYDVFAGSAGASNINTITINVTYPPCTPIWVPMSVALCMSWVPYLRRCISTSGLGGLIGQKLLFQVLTKIPHVQFASIFPECRSMVQVLLAAGVAPNQFLIGPEDPNYETNRASHGCSQSQTCTPWQHWLTNHGIRPCWITSDDYVEITCMLLEAGALTNLDSVIERKAQNLLTSTLTTQEQACKDTSKKKLISKTLQLNAAMLDRANDHDTSSDISDSQNEPAPNHHRRLIGLYACKNKSAGSPAASVVRAEHGETTPHFCHPSIRADHKLKKVWRNINAQSRP